ncbi:TerB family tellurite resistance protein [Hankyongella ginsenosidimutans]|uniref:TerB family tellurite resistance protein n=1 Tax=Hankyongella ginsenosidimutans TaxID=1763828 RepID=UPI001CA36A4A|nr:TerB family tellurite resistance protein [Hankyongella ginsenosidimutans]
MDRAPLKPVETQSAAFTIAAIALAAKLSAADGRSSEAEFRTFQRLFSVEPGEAENVARFYRFAQKSPHGFELYASQARDTLGLEIRCLSICSTACS